MNSEAKKIAWLCSDGKRTKQHEADTPDEAAFRFTLDSTYEVKCCTIYPSIAVWPQGEEQSESNTAQVMVRIDPDEPACPGHRQHGWRKPEGNGIYPRGEGVLIVSNCCHCGLELSLNTHDNSHGVKPLPVLRYRQP